MKLNSLIKRYSFKISILFKWDWKKKSQPNSIRGMKIKGWGKKSLANTAEKGNRAILISDKGELKGKNILGIKELFKLIKGIFYQKVKS